MLLAVAATLVGLAALAWSADKFVMGASAVARYLGMAPLLIGIVVIGFGTSAPELVVSALAAADGDPELALGNAIGSNIANIGLILGVTAIVLPVAVHRGVLRRELPILLIVTALATGLLLDRELSAVDAGILLVTLVAVIGWNIWEGRTHGDDQLAVEAERETSERGLSRRAAWGWLLAGVVLLVLASRVLVWGAVGIAERLGWSDLVIGLTVVAIGTSAPELAAAIAAVRKGENDLALGNVIGSNLFNTLGVIGLAGVIAPATVSSELLTRDLPVLWLFTVLLFLFGIGIGRQGRINRVEGGALLGLWLLYTGLLIATAG